jgi:hypothetical protein
MNEFKPRLVLDSRINDITDKIDIAVESSAAQSTYQPFRSINTSNSSITFNVNVPSENIAIDRRILIQTDLNFEVNITGATIADDVVFQWGRTDGLGQFPLNGLFSQVQATINNVSVSSPIEDIMPSLLRMCDQKEVSKYNLLTASYLDQNFSTLEGCDDYASNPLAGMGAVNYDATIMPRGVIVPTIVIEQKTVDGVAVSNSAVCATAGNIFKISITVSLTEPLLFLSPFAGLTKSQDDACLLGINNMNIICNIRSNLGGLFKTSKPYNYAVSLGFDGSPAFSEPKLLMNLLTLQPEQYSRINNRNVLAIQDYPRFVTTHSETIVNGTNKTFTFSIIQLNQIPDTILIFVRPPRSYDSADGGQYKRQTGYFSIQSATISFNNQSGILASCSKEELYNLSKSNGSKQSYQDFIGQANYEQASGGTTSSNVRATQGSLLVVKPAYNFNLPTFLSGGSLGQFGLQITLSATNYLSYDVVNPEMVVVVVNSGLMVTQQGSSSLYSGLLTKNMVLETKQQSPAIDSSSFHSLVGGSIQESCSTGLRKVLKKHFGKGYSGGGFSGGQSKIGEEVGKFSGAVNKMSKYM